MESNDVVVTGAGVFTPNGKDLESFWSGITEGRSGVVSIEDRLDNDDFPVRFASAFRDYEPEQHFSTLEARRMDKFVQFGIISAEEALKHAEIDLEEPSYDPERAGVVFGTGVGGLETYEEQYENYRKKGPRQVSPYMIPKFIVNMISGQVAIRANCRGPNKAVVTACAAGSLALGNAYRLIGRGEADVMVAGGSEAAITPLGLAGFYSPKAMSTRNENPGKASRPFDRDRDGFVLGEGSGTLILESRELAEERGADIHASLFGFGQTADAQPVRDSRNDGERAANCMALTLEDAGLEPESVDYVNAHGTSTPGNDRTETLAIRKTFGETADELKVSSTKSTTGHLLGATGAIEAIACVLAIRRNVVPPTINYETPDPECDLDYVPNTKESTNVSVALSNSFGFDGHNVALIFTESRPY